MAKAPAFQFYPKDYESDENVKMMSLEQEGAFLRLLCHSWLNGSVPADVPSLAKICRVPASKMARLWPGVAACFVEVQGGRLVNLRQEQGRSEQDQFRKERSESGLRGATSKWMAKPSKGNGSAKAHPQAQPQQTDGLRSAVSVLQSATARQEGTYEPAPDVRAENAIRSERVRNERELLRVVGLLADKLPDRDPPDIMREVTAYKAANDGRLITGRVNPALLSDERLTKSLADAQGWLADLEKKAVPQ